MPVINLRNKFFERVFGYGLISNIILIVAYLAINIEILSNLMKYAEINSFAAMGIAAFFFVIVILTILVFALAKVYRDKYRDEVDALVEENLDFYKQDDKEFCSLIYEHFSGQKATKALLVLNLSIVVLFVLGFIVKYTAF